MKEKHERYRVKPGLSLTSKDLYRRYRNNSLNINNSGNQYGMDIEVQEFTRMDKTQQLNSMKETFDNINNIKKQRTKYENDLKIYKANIEKQKLAEKQITQSQPNQQENAQPGQNQ